MSIPLDRLYNFLDSVSNHDLVIYGWLPHGSKKLKDLSIWRPGTANWRERRTLPVMIFHDQEPLDYDFHQESIDQQFCEVVNNWTYSPLLHTPLMQNFCKSLHLAGICRPGASFYDTTLLVHSEKNSNEVNKFQLNNFVPVYYWSHAVISQDWFRFAKHDPELCIKSPSPKTFLIYNRAWAGSREYRLTFSEMLVDSGIYQCCNIKFSELDDGIHYTDHVFKNTKLKITRDNLQNVLPQNTYDSTSSADYNAHDYQNSLIEVVLETLFDDQRQHLTEKTLRPIACRQPFILAATPGSLQYLRDYGFKTFSDVIDETYDTIQDPTERLQAIIQEMQRISSLTAQQKQELIAAMQPIVEHNQQWFFSDRFFNQLIDEFKQNLDCGVATVKSGSVGNVWKQFRETAQEHYAELFFKIAHHDSDDIAWANKWIQSNTKS
jgi:hypothetical protein